MFTGNCILLFMAFWPIAGAFVSYLIGRANKTARDYFADAACILEFALAVFLLVKTAGGASFAFCWDGFCSRSLSLKLDGFRAIYVTIASLMWMMTTVFAKEYLHHYRNRNRYYLFVMMTFGATVGMFLSADLFTTFIFFEVMSLSSYVMVAQDEKPGALRAGDTYLAVAVLGGMVMLMGLFLLEAEVGTLDMASLAEGSMTRLRTPRLYAACACLLFGFGAKAGMYPLHIWLPKAHPVAPAPASALLSGILTKCGVFGILIITSHILLHDAKWGFMMLMFGVVTMFLGALLAVFSIDLKRTLACSSMSQIGFILVGVGMQGLLAEENMLAVRGTLLHMVNHSMLKLVLFMVAGVIYMNLHKLNLNEIRGFGKHKPLLNIIFLMGVLGIIGMPGWNGYISKTLLHESIVEYMEVLAEEGIAITLYKVIEWIFLISGGLTAAYMTKLYICIFWEKNVHAQEKMDASNHHYMNWQSTIALLVPAMALPVMGMLPWKIMDFIANLGETFMFSEGLEEKIAYFSLTNLKGGAISLGIGAIVYLAVIRPFLMAPDGQGNRIYVDRWPSWLDLENLIYRPMMLIVLPFIGAFGSRILDKFTDTIVYLGKISVFRDRKPEKQDHVFGFMKSETAVGETHRQITGTFTFSILLFAAGLAVVLIYLLMDL